MKQNEKIKLTKRQIRQWVNALRSGKYKQTDGVLCSDHGEDEYTEDMRFCCLGVACDLFLEGDWEQTRHHGVRLALGRNRFAAGMPPSDLRSAIDEALGFGPEDDEPSKAAEKQFGYEDPCDALAAMNDTGKTFKQIAKAIEKAAGL